MMLYPVMKKSRAENIFPGREMGMEHERMSTVGRTMRCIGWIKICNSKKRKEYVNRWPR
jgi:hypothetical protein